MTIRTSRRRFLAATASGLVAAAVARPTRAWAHRNDRRLRVDSRTIDVGGRTATIWGIVDEGTGTPFRFAVDQPFQAIVDNRIDEPTLIHWHGLTPPWMQDGVPGLPHPAIDPHASHRFSFRLNHPGTFWMHSHVGLQLQRLLAAPLIVEDPADAGTDRQEIVVMLQDFSFRPPEEILADLSGGENVPAAGEGGHDMTSMSGMAAQSDDGTNDMNAMDAGPTHTNDLDHDAYLANDRTLDDPSVVAVERGGTVRLRIVNAAASTNFHIDSGALMATLVAVDGSDIVPARVRRVPLAMGQRIDLDVTIPTAGGAFPILALREGARERTGIVLATPGARIARMAPAAEGATLPIDLGLEAALTARSPLPVREADRRLAVTLTGSHSPYRWALAIADAAQDRPVEIAQGERVELTMTNASAMPHPMHLHGHEFQVVDLGGGRFSGARRDTIQVPPGGTVTVAFDADNPGHWAFHCHHLYHMAAGMMTTLDYRGSV